MASTNKTSDSHTTTIDEEEEDEFFGDQENCSDGDGLNAYELSATASRFQTIGYHETFASSECELLQTGFTHAYLATFDAARDLGYILGQKLAANNDDWNNLDNETANIVSRLGDVVRHQQETVRESNERDEGVESLDSLKQQLRTETDKLKQMSIDLKRQANTMQNGNGEETDG